MESVNNLSEEALQSIINLLTQPTVEWEPIVHNGVTYDTWMCVSIGEYTFTIKKFKNLLHGDYYLLDVECNTVDNNSTRTLSSCNFPDIKIIWEHAKNIIRNSKKIDKFWSDVIHTLENSSETNINNFK